mmetsp:Transcript_30453/g.55342  ORF Transcript_30453/g.55342 Transcript_30453/m.55342 type:complete len:206 (-) Transcript_30453:184-801(-)
MLFGPWKKAERSRHNKNHHKLHLLSTTNLIPSALVVVWTTMTGLFGPHRPQQNLQCHLQHSLLMKMRMSLASVAAWTMTMASAVGQRQSRCPRKSELPQTRPRQAMSSLAWTQSLPSASKLIVPRPWSSNARKRQMLPKPPLAQPSLPQISRRQLLLQELHHQSEAVLTRTLLLASQLQAAPHSKRRRTSLVSVSASTRNDLTRE